MRSSHDLQCIFRMGMIVRSMGERRGTGLFACELGDFEDFLNHLLLLGSGTCIERRRHATVQMPFHQRMMGGFEEPDHRQVLLHDIDAVGVSFDHCQDLLKQAIGFLQGDVRFFLLRRTHVLTWEIANMIPPPQVWVKSMLYGAALTSKKTQKFRQPEAIGD